MDTILELQPELRAALPLAIVLGLLAIDAHWTLRTHRRILSQMPESPHGSYFALAYEVWYRPVLIAVAGLATLFGSQIAFILFAAGTVGRAIAPAREAVAEFLAGRTESRGKERWVLGSAYGAAWFGTTRGIPLVLLYACTHTV